MHALVQTAFARLYALDAEEEERKLSDSDSNVQDVEGKMTVTTEASDRPQPESEGAEAEPTLSPQQPSVNEQVVEQVTSPSGPRAKCGCCQPAYCRQNLTLECRRPTFDSGTPSRPDQHPRPH